MIHLTTTAISAVFLAALSACAGSAPVLEEQYEILEISQGITPGDPFSERLCKGFFMSDENVRAFLRRAKQIGNSQLHYEYDWAPCYVEARILSKDRVANVQIRASGVASLRFTGGEQISLGCLDECDDLLREKRE